jgi:hypothetical protein
MGLATGNIPPHEQRRREQEALEAKRAKRQALPLRISVLIRPNLPPCFTTVMHATSNARVADVLAEAWELFGDERARRGRELGPLPTYRATDYCLRRYYTAGNTVGHECPSRALIARLVATPVPPPQPGKTVGGGGLGSSGVSNTRAASGTFRHVSDSMATLMTDGGSFRFPAALRAAPSQTHAGVVDGFGSSVLASVTLLSSGAGGLDDGGTGGSPDASAFAFGDLNLLDANHFAIVLRPTYLLSERIVASESATRVAIEAIFDESLQSMALYERDKRSVAAGLQLQREEFGGARLELERKEQHARAAAMADWQQIHSRCYANFRERYDEMETAMLTLGEKMVKLRMAHRATMEHAATRMQHQQQ